MMTESYDFTKARRGTAIIINNVDFYMASKREGADKDMDNVYRAFRNLGFDRDDIFMYRNLTTTQMYKCLDNSMRKDDHVNSDCFMCAVMTHGQEGDLVCGINGSVALSELVKIVEDCRALDGKPKIFLVQACRGDQLSKPVEVRHVEGAPDAKLGPAGDSPDIKLGPAGDSPDIKLDTDGDSPDDVTDLMSKLVRDFTDSVSLGPGEGPGAKEDEDEKAGVEPEQPLSKEEIDKLHQIMLLSPAEIPISRDSLLVYATQPGFLSFRNTKLGSHFIRHFCRQVANNGSSLDFLSLLTRVNRDVAFGFTSSADKDSELHGKKMMPWIASRLSKNIIFCKKA